MGAAFESKDDLRAKIRELRELNAELLEALEAALYFLRNDPCSAGAVYAANSAEQAIAIAKAEKLK